MRRPRSNILYISYMGLSEPLIESQALAYLKGLSVKGNNICILTFEKYKFLSKSRLQRIKEVLGRYNIDWFFLRYHKSPVFFVKSFDLLSGLAFTFYIILAKRIDIIHARGAMPAFFSFCTARILGRKFIFDARGLMAKEYLDGNIWEKTSLYYLVVDYLEKIILRNADSVTVLTEKIKNVIGLRHYAGVDIINTISVIPTSVDTGIFSIKSDLSDKIRKEMGLGDRFIFLYIGSLGTWYMLREMAEFVNVNRLNFKDPFFLIVTQSDVGIAKSILRKAGFKESDFAVIYSEHKDIPAYINSADAGIMFIKSCFSKDASCPTKFGEYLACGLPVVLNTGIGDCDRIIETYNVGVLVRGFDKSGYMNSGKRLKELVKEKTNIADRCREAAVREFSLNKAVENYNKIYKELVK